MKIVLVIWLAMTPGKWSASEVEMESLEACHEKVWFLRDVYKSLKAYEFVLRCEGR